MGSGLFPFVLRTAGDVNNSDDKRPAHSPFLLAGSVQGSNSSVREHLFRSINNTTYLPNANIGDLFFDLRRMLKRSVAQQSSVSSKADEDASIAHHSRRVLANVACPAGSGGERLLIADSSSNVYRWRAIRAVYPTAAFVVVAVNPFEWCSTVKRDLRVIPEWLRPHLINSEWNLDWALAEYWTEYYERSVALRDSDPSRALIFTTSDLHSRTQNCHTTLCSFLGRDNRFSPVHGASLKLGHVVGVPRASGPEARWPFSKLPDSIRDRVRATASSLGFEFER